MPPRVSTVTFRGGNINKHSLPRVRYCYKTVFPFFFACIVCKGTLSFHVTFSMNVTYLIILHFHFEVIGTNPLDIITPRFLVNVIQHAMPTPKILHQDVSLNQYEKDQLQLFYLEWLNTQKSLWLFLLQRDINLILNLSFSLPKSHHAFFAQLTIVGRRVIFGCILFCSKQHLYSVSTSS